MADGPHRSLPMSRYWKKVAENAATEACGIDEVRGSLVTALYRDLMAIPAKLLDGIKDVLFGDPRLNLGGELEALRKAAAGSPFGNAVLDFVIQAKGTNLESREALVKGVTLAAMDRTARHLRQMEEHYKRKSDKARSQRLAERTAEAGQGIAVFAETLMRDALFSKEEVVWRQTKKTGIDDGVEVGGGAI